jgi:hypothetical protein
MSSKLNNTDIERAAMTQLLIQGLRKEYAAIDKALDWAYESDYSRVSEMDEAYSALHSIIEKLILSSTSYRGMTDADEVAHNLALDMRYVTEDSLSEQEMKEREEWHWKRLKELNMAN